jgi:hypothetical protein
MALGFYTLSFLDYDGEPSHFRTAWAQLDALTVLTIGAEVALFRAAVAGISGGTIAREQFSQFDNDLSRVLPANPVYQRESKWLVRYHDTVTNKEQRTQIPCANLSLLSNHSEFLDITTALSPGQVFKTQFEADVLSEAGNSILVDSVQQVGRDL